MAPPRIVYPSFQSCKMFDLTKSCLSSCYFLPFYMITVNVDYMTEIIFYITFNPFSHVNWIKMGHEIGYFDTSKYGTPSKIGLGTQCHIRGNTVCVSKELWRLAEEFIFRTILSVWKEYLSVSFELNSMAKRPFPSHDAYSVGKTTSAECGFNGLCHSGPNYMQTTCIFNLTKIRPRSVQLHDKEILCGTRHLKLNVFIGRDTRCVH